MEVLVTTEPTIIAVLTTEPPIMVSLTVRSDG